MNALQKELHSKALQISTRFRKLETELICILQEIDEKKVFLALGFPTLFAYANQALQLSESNAYTFVALARKSKAIPELKKEIESGNLAVSKARRILPVLTRENHEEWIQKAETLSKRELEVEVAKVNPEPVRETVRQVSATKKSLKVALSNSAYEKLERVRALVSNSKAKPASLEETIEAALNLFLEKKDPVQKKAKPQLGPGPKSGGGVVKVGRTPIPEALKRAVLQRDQGKCQYQAQGQKCRSSYFVHLHHRIPISQGGKHELENLVTLCSNHHQYYHAEGHQRFLAVQNRRRENALTP